VVVFALLALLSVAAVNALMTESQMNALHESLLDVEAEGASTSMMTSLKAQLKAADGKSGMEGVIKILQGMLRKYEVMYAAVPTGMIDCNQAANNNDPYCESLQEMAELEKRIRETATKITKLDTDVATTDSLIQVSQRAITNIRGEISVIERKRTVKEKEQATTKANCDKRIAAAIENGNDAKRLLDVLESIKGKLANRDMAGFMEIANTLEQEAHSTQSQTVRNLLEAAGEIASLAEHGDVKKDAKNLKDVIDQLIMVLKQRVSPTRPRRCEMVLVAIGREINGYNAEISSKQNSISSEQAKMDPLITRLADKRRELAEEKKIKTGLEKSLTDLRALNISPHVLPDQKRMRIAKIIAFLKTIINELQKASSASKPKTLSVLRNIKAEGSGQGQWIAGAWSSCNKAGIATRKVTCFKGDSSHWTDCDIQNKPKGTKTCQKKDGSRTPRSPAPTVPIATVSRPKTQPEVTSTPYEDSEKVLLFSHRTNGARGPWFKNAQEAMQVSGDVTQAFHKYSRLNELEKYRGADGYFELWLNYPNSVHGIKGGNRWKQKVNPVTQREGLGNAAADFKAISLSFKQTGGGTPFTGLRRSRSGATFLDSEPAGSGWWWNSIGSFNEWGGGIPGIWGPEFRLGEKADQFVQVWAYKPKK